MIRISVLSMFLFTVIAALTLSVTSPSAQPYPEAQWRALTRPIAVAQFTDRGDGVMWEGTINVPTARYFRVQFSDTTRPKTPDRVRVVLRGLGEQGLATYSGADLIEWQEFLTGPIFSQGIRIQLYGDLEALSGFSFKIMRVLLQPVPTGPKPEAYSANWKAASQIRLSKEEQERRWIPDLDPVAKLYLPTGDSCTGFLISRQYLLTNYHCLEKSAAALQEIRAGLRPSSCGDIWMQFGFERQLAREMIATTRCVRVLDAGSELDFALLQVGPASALPKTFLNLAATAPNATDEDYAQGYIVATIHHPEGREKFVSVGCYAYPPDQAGVVEHTCSTGRGSSGAPVISKNSDKVIALHFRIPWGGLTSVEQIQNASQRGDDRRAQGTSAHLIYARIRQLIESDR